MIAIDLIKELKRLPETTPVIFRGTDGGWNNIEIEYKNNELNIKQDDYDGIFTSDKSDLEKG